MSDSARPTRRLDLAIVTFHSRVYRCWNSIDEIMSRTTIAPVLKRIDVLLLLDATRLSRFLVANLATNALEQTLFLFGKRVVRRQLDTLFFHVLALLDCEIERWVL